VFSIDTFNAPVENSSRSSSPAPDGAVQPATPAPESPSQNPANGRWIGLLFDDINTSPGDLAHAKIAASRFIKEAVQSGDRIAVFVTSGGEVAEFTNQPTVVLATVTRVQSHPRTSPSGLALCPRMTPYEAYQIVKGDPAAMKAKVVEACNCSGNGDCPNGMVEAIPDADLMNPKFGSGQSIGNNQYGGAGTLSSLINTVMGQAEQTWEQTHEASLATLDAIKNSLDQLARRPGKRMLLLASSGFLSGMLDEQQDAIINEAVHAGVVINSLDAKGLYAETPGTPINESVETASQLPSSTVVFQMRSIGERVDELDSAMARFAESTGGLLFRNNNDLDLGFYRLGMSPYCTYLLGFTPGEDGKYHKIKVELKNASHDFVQVRPGYFAPAKASSDYLPSATEKMDAVMRGSGERTDLPATISEKLGSATSGGLQLTIQAHIDIQKLPFGQQNDRRVQTLTFVAALFDSHGNFVTGKQADMKLALKPESFDRFSRTGINGSMQLEVPPGTYRLRFVVQEAIQGTINATSKELQIR